MYRYPTNNSPKVKPRVLMSALLQITIDTDDTTDKPKAPIVPSWNFWLSPIFFFLTLALSKSYLQQSTNPKTYPKSTIFAKYSLKEPPIGRDSAKATYLITGQTKPNQNSRKR